MIIWPKTSPFLGDCWEEMTPNYNSRKGDLRVNEERSDFYCDDERAFMFLICIRVTLGGFFFDGVNEKNAKVLLE